MKSLFEIYCDIMQKLCALRLSKEYAELFDADQDNPVLADINEEIENTAKKILNEADSVRELRKKFEG